MESVYLALGRYIPYVLREATPASPTRCGDKMLRNSRIRSLGMDPSLVQGGHDSNASPHETMYAKLAHCQIPEIRCGRPGGVRFS